jgi:hypothetical protein
MPWCSMFLARREIQAFFDGSPECSARRKRKRSKIVKNYKFKLCVWYFGAILMETMNSLGSRRRWSAGKRRGLALPYLKVNSVRFLWRDPLISLGEVSGKDCLVISAMYTNSSGGRGGSMFPSRFVQKQSERILTMTIVAASIAIAQVATPISSTTAPVYLSRAQLAPRNREVLAAMGPRLEVPGNERIKLSGSLTTTGAPVVVQITTQWPELLRIDSPGSSSLLYTSNGIQKSAGAITQQDLDLLNTLMFDFVDHYLLQQSRGNATRVIGPALVKDDPTVTGSPVWNLFKVADLVQSVTGPSQSVKVYGFNITTRLLENVAYTQSLAGVQATIQTRFTNWQPVQQNYLPGKITRFENGVAKLTLVVNSASIGPQVADGIFSTP